MFLNPLHVILSFINQPGGFHRLYRSIAQCFGKLKWAAVPIKITRDSNDSIKTDWVSLLFQHSTVTWQVKMNAHYNLSTG